MKSKLTKFRDKLKVNYKKIVTIATAFILMFPNVAFATSTTQGTTYIATPVFFTGTGKLLAAALTLVLGLVGAYTTIQVVLEFFKYIDAESEERKMHMKGIKGKAVGGIGAVCASGVIGWILAFYV